MKTANRCLNSTRRPLGLGLLALALVAAVTNLAVADKPQQGKNAAKKNAALKNLAANKNVPANKPAAPRAPKSSVLTDEAWQRAPLTPLRAGELDQLITKELAESKIEPAALTTDEQFIRRVTLDVTGQLPTPADVNAFVADPSSQKRSLLIDRLLASDEYSHHWARYWRDVIASRLNDRRGMGLSRAFEHWLADEFKDNHGWDKIVRTILTAEGKCTFDADDKNGAIFFLAAHVGNDAANERAAETARVFLGIQLQCAQCHDHPFDQWKQVQFHELAAYFARLRERPVREANMLQGMQLISAPRGEHEMPGKQDPKKTLTTNPRYLDGKSPGMGLGDVARRKSLADAITSKKNYWFAGAYVNRIWGELMGQSFYQPVDDMGPKKEAVFPSVLTRLTGAFRGTDFDVREMFRMILNSQAYQRQIRPGETSDQHLHFAAAYPTRLRADALWESLNTVLGALDPPGDRFRPRPMGGPFAALGGGPMERQFNQEFSFDPSLKPDEIEGSIPQALMLMNNPRLNQKMSARGSNLLGRILSSYADDSEAVKMVYLKALARKPSDRELEKCLAYLNTGSGREQGFEDILWAIVNSTEFQTKR